MLAFSFWTPERATTESLCVELGPDLLLEAVEVMFVENAATFLILEADAESKLVLSLSRYHSCWTGGGCRLTSTECFVVSGSLTVTMTFRSDIDF